MAYGSLEDLAASFPPPAVQTVSAAAKQAALDKASSMADGYMQSQGPVPLTVWPASVTTHVCAMAVYLIMKGMGFNPDGGDKLIRTGYDDGIRFFSDVSKGIVTLPRQQTAPTVSQVPRASSDDPRGW